MSEDEMVELLRINGKGRTTDDDVDTGEADDNEVHDNNIIKIISFQ